MKTVEHTTILLGLASAVILDFLLNLENASKANYRADVQSLIRMESASSAPTGIILITDCAL